MGGRSGQAFPAHGQEWPDPREVEKLRHEVAKLRAELAIPKAPLLLIPVKLERRKVRSGFRLVAHDDDSRINPTHLERLRQDFRLAMPNLEKDMAAAGENALDVSRIWRLAGVPRREGAPIGGPCNRPKVWGLALIDRLSRGGKAR